MVWRDLPSTGSLFRWPEGQRSGRLKPGVSTRSPVWVSETQNCSIFCSFPWHIRRELDWKWGSWNSNQYLYEMPKLQVWLFLFATVLIPSQHLRTFLDGRDSLEKCTTI